MRRAEPGDGRVLERAVHRQPSLQDLRPPGAEVILQQHRAAGPVQQPAVAVQRFQRLEGHGALQALEFSRAQALAAQDVGERDHPARPDHARTLRDQPRLVGHVRKRFLSDHHIETGAREGHVQGVAEAEIDQVREPDQLGQAHRRLVSARRDVQPGDPAAEPRRQIARRPAHAAAHVQDPGRGVDAGLLGQNVDRLQAAEVILVVVLEGLFRQRLELDAVGAQLLDDLVLVDRMRLVEANDRSQLFLLAHRCAPAASLRQSGGGGTTPVWVVIRP